MHVVLNAQLLSMAQSYRGAGVSNYSRQLVEALAQELGGGTNDRITALVSDARFQSAGLHLQRTALVVQNPLVRIAWEQVILPAELRRLGADLVHGLVNVLPLATPTPGVVTVHDLSFLRLPQTLPAAKRGYLARLCRASVAKARQVIAVSRQTADDLLTFFGTPAGKITVIHNGVGEHFRPGDEASAAAFRRRHQLPDRFVLYVGTLEPRKNLTLLLQAYADWRRRAGEEARQTRLILAGARGWFYEQIFAQVQSLGLTEDVLFPGFLPEADLPDWYRAAALFVYPSLLEGFGLPVLEAMACGTPVVCSRAGSLLEIAGDSALTFPAQQATALADCLHMALTQTALRSELRRRGLERASAFTWQRTAAATLALYRATIG